MIIYIILYIDLGARGSIRFYVLLNYLKNDITTMLLGSGNGKLFITNFGFYGLHSTFGNILNYTGIVGFLSFLFFFISKLFKVYFSSVFVYRYWMLTFPVISWLVFGLLHNLTYCSIIWVIFGLMSNKSFVEKNITKLKKI